MNGFVPAVRCGVLAAVLCAGALRAETSGPRAFTTRDAVELSSIVHYTVSEEGFTRAAPVFSPDRKYFFLITERGDLARDYIESTIWLFARRAVVDYVLRRSAVRPVPRAIATLAATSNTAVLSGARWLEDSTRITFLGKKGSPYQRLFIVDVRTGSLTAVSGDNDFVSAYDIRGDTIAYTTLIPLAPAPPGDEMAVVSRKSLESLLYPQPPALEDAEWESLSNRATSLHVWRKGSELPVTFRFQGRPLRLFPASWSLAPPLAIAPDGGSLITVAPVPEVPAGWDAYPPQPSMGIPRLVPGDPRAVADDNFAKPLQFVRVDLRTGEASPLVEAPAGRNLGYIAPTQAFWTADSRSAVLCDTFLPGTASPVIAAVDVATRAPRSVLPLSLPAAGQERSYLVEEVQWDVAKEELKLTYSGSRQPPLPETFSLRSGQWIKLLAPPAGPGDGVDLAVEEAVDRAPVLSGRRHGDGVLRVVWDPNPQLAGLALGKVSLFHWQDRKGVPWAGILALPPGYDPRRRYPLVIQTHGYGPDRFFVDGRFTTGSGGRALAARDVVVLQMDMPSKHVFTAADAPFQLDGFQSAVARLAADGVIDPRRVGVIGFSYTCFHTLYALTHDPHLFAAAAITDGNEMSYTQYIFRDPEIQDIMDKVNGGPPWGPGLASWMERAPTFNLDKVAAPLLISAFERWSLLSQYEPYAVLSRLGKPVEMLWLRRENATHVLKRPYHRYLSQESAVDWFDFWLNGHEDPDLAKAGQYARWRELRKLSPQ
jgi:prolyl oligopeptidase family protein